MAKCLTKKEVAEQIGIGMTTLNRWMEDRKIPYYKLPGGSVRFDADKITNWLRLREVRQKAA